MKSRAEQSSRAIKSPFTLLRVPSEPLMADPLPTHWTLSLFVSLQLEQKQKEALELLEQNRHLQDQLKVALGREQSAREGYVLQVGERGGERNPSSLRPRGTLVGFSPGCSWGHPGGHGDVHHRVGSKRFGLFANVANSVALPGSSAQRNLSSGMQ